jgi:hypothetical protein
MLQARGLLRTRRAPHVSSRRLESGHVRKFLPAVAITGREAWLWSNFPQPDLWGTRGHLSGNRVNQDLATSDGADRVPGFAFEMQLKRVRG